MDIKSGNPSEAVSATANKLADTAGKGVTEDEMVDIGVDGSLVEFYPGFEEYMREALRAIDGIGPSGERRIRIGIAKDGSGVGAALIALVANKMEKPVGENYIGDLRRALNSDGLDEKTPDSAVEFSPTDKSPLSATTRQFLKPY